MKVTIGTQDGETFQKEVEDASQIFGKKIGETFDGGIIGLSGYKLKITGGSDRDGFPMKATREGTERKKVLLKKGVGLNVEKEGERQRKSVRGNTVSNQIEQLNTKVIESGEKTVEELIEE
ncbi:MAG: 30S ribosomal protein S6e [Candidatus Nanosalina sp.]